MERRHTALVERIRIRTSLYEVFDDVHLRDRLPVIGVRSIVKRLSPSTISGAAVSATPNEQFGDRPLKRCGSHVQSSIARVEVMANLLEKECRRVLARCPASCLCGHESWIRSKQTRRSVDLTSNRSADQFHEPAFFDGWEMVRHWNCVQTIAL
jgi:hypothetical protein